MTILKPAIGAIASSSPPASGQLAVEFNSSGEYYQSSSTTGAISTACSMCCWVKVPANPGTDRAIVSLSKTAGGDTYFQLMCTTARNINFVNDGQSVSGLVVDATGGGWVFAAVSVTSGSTKLCLALENAGIFGGISTGTTSTLPASTSFIWVGNNAFGEQPLNGQVAHYRIWSGVFLNELELLLEMHSNTPVRSSNLFANYEFASGPQTNDESGNGHTLTANGSLSSQNGPSVGYTVTAPSLSAQGSVVANTTGNLTVTLGTHAGGDILIVALAYWGPNSTVANVPTGPGGSWAEIHSATLSDGTNTDGWWGLYWMRATSSSETNPTFGRNSLDTGTDGVFAGQAFTIRNCKLTGTPWDDAQESSLYSTANQNMPAVTVSGASRSVIQFLMSSDDQTAGAAPSGYTAGTAGTSGTGTDAGFQTYRQTNISSSVSAIASATAAPVQGRYYYVGVSFIGQGV